MKACALTISLSLAALTAAAQAWKLPWISNPSADSTAQTWFRKTFTLKSRPAAASIHVASDGRFIVYVNGYNVSSDVLEPFDGGGMMRYDASRFLRDGANTVAVWYSPKPPCRPTTAQVALSLCGAYASGERFATATDGTWFCRLANGTTEANGDETVCANDHVSDWNITGCGIVGWQAAEETPNSRMDTDISPWHDALHVAQIQSHESLYLSGGSITYTFARRFEGWVRLTLRGMERGDTIRMNGLTYVCSGDDDEQACRRFTTATQDAVVVDGRGTLTRDNITNVEAIAIEPYLHRSYRY